MIDIQPYVHAGMYSEGEFAVSPTIVQLAAQRKLPVGVDWDTSMLGHDEGKEHLLSTSTSLLKALALNRI